MDKQEIRKEISRKLKEQDQEEKKLKSEAIEKKLFSCEIFKRAHVVMFYISKEEEVDTHHMIKEAFRRGKKVIVPYSVSETKKIIASELQDPEKDLEIGPYGIHQPKKESIKEVPLDNIDLVIVPGVAYDEKNYRLGRGKGYYDRFLRKLSSGTVTVGICFDFQLVKDLPKDEHDFPVSKIITN